MPTSVTAVFEVASCVRVRNEEMANAGNISDGCTHRHSRSLSAAVSLVLTEHSYCEETSVTAVFEVASRVRVRNEEMTNAGNISDGCTHRHSRNLSGID
ncbi:hypothetical protein J6590_062386 [Homalodisca vitripennis]|nr:hypothetical protein J6590_062386 [Homalodisca vitripennis]